MKIGDTLTDAGATRIYLYGLSGADGRIRYVGQTPMPTLRLRAHVGATRRVTRPTRAQGWMRAVLAAGPLTMRILDIVTTQSTADARERELIVSTGADLNVRGRIPQVKRGA